MNSSVFKYLSLGTLKNYKNQVFILVGVGNEDGKILGHSTIFNSFNDGIFQMVTEVVEFLVVIELGSVEETSSPSEDGGNRVGGSFLTLKSH